MATRCRCTECRKRFVPAATTGERQRTCSPECRLTRRRKQAKRRRLAALKEHREGDLERQQRRREAASESGCEAECHEPASGAKVLELLPKVHQIVDRTLRLSRTDFGRQLRRIERILRPIVFAEGAGNGRRLDGVTDRLPSKTATMSTR